MAAFAPEVIAHLGPLPVTNTLLHTLIVDGIILGTAISLSKSLTLVPKGLQAIVEPVLESFYSLTESIAPSKKALDAIFPYAATFFLFIFISNFTGLLPGVGTIGFFGKGDEFIPLLRSATSDFNTTSALAVVSVIATHMISIQLTGFKDYFTRWFSLNPINLYVGLLELIAEVTKMVSLSFRLFGNILAGEITLHTISSLFAFIAPLPFLLLESIVSVVQALVFSILTLVFMAVLSTPHHVQEHAPTTPDLIGIEGKREVNH